LWDHLDYLLASKSGKSATIFFPSTSKSSPNYVNDTLRLNLKEHLQKDLMEFIVLIFFVFDYFFEEFAISAFTMIFSPSIA